MYHGLRRGEEFEDGALVLVIAEAVVNARFRLRRYYSIEGDDLVPVLQELSDHVPSDVAAAARYNHFHAAYLLKFGLVLACVRCL